MPFNESRPAAGHRPIESPHTTEAEPEVCFIDTEACQARDLNSSHTRMGEQFTLMQCYSRLNVKVINHFRWTANFMSGVNGVSPMLRQRLATLNPLLFPRPRSAESAFPMALFIVGRAPTRCFSHQHFLFSPNCVQGGTRYLPNGAAEALRHQKVNIWLAWSSHLSTHLTIGVAPNI